MRYLKTVLSMTMAFVLIFGSGFIAYAIETPPEEYTMTVKVSSTSTDLGIVVGSGSYIENEEIDISATPDQGYRLQKWMIKVGLEDEIVLDKPTSFVYVMPSEDVVLTAHFEEIPKFEVTGSVLPLNSGTVKNLNHYKIGDSVTLIAEPNKGFVFDKWIFDEEIITPVIMENELTFIMPDEDIAITAHFVEGPYVWVTFQYHNTQGNDVKAPSDAKKVYYGAYSFNPDVISGWQPIYSTPNHFGTITENSENFTVVFVYQVPPTPTVITDTVYVTETVTVTVPATTAPITEEQVPLAPSTDILDIDSIYDQDPIDLDAIYDQTPAPTTQVDEEIVLEDVPLADALPQTGQLPAEGFYGIGGLISAIGIFVKKRLIK